MTEISPGDNPSPAAGNLIQQPLSPEQAGLRDKFTGLADSVLAHYGAQAPRMQPTRHPETDRTLDSFHYHDGTERQVTWNRDGSVQTKLYMSQWVRDPRGRRAMFIADQDPQGRVTYDMRLLPTGTQDATIYRWSRDEPVGEVRGSAIESVTVPLVAGSREFTSASAEVDQVGFGWTRLLEGQDRDGSKKLSPTAERLAKLAGAVMRRFGAGARRSK